VLLGHLENGLGYYRFAYNGSDKAYVGVMAQEVQTVRPDAVTRGSDGYLRVYYERLGLKFQSYDSWTVSGGVLPRTAGPPRLKATPSVRPTHPIAGVGAPDTS
jgi:hypothetical protein